jgi:hypothetical protein
LFFVWCVQQYALCHHVFEAQLQFSTGDAVVLQQKGCCEPCDAAVHTGKLPRPQGLLLSAAGMATRTLKTRTTIIRHLIVTRPAKILLKNTLLR